MKEKSRGKEQKREKKKKEKGLMANSIREKNETARLFTK